MNRSVLIPAVCCLFAFAALLATLHGAPGRETTAAPPLSTASEVVVNANVSKNVRLLPAAEARRVLTSLGDEYMRPWRNWEKSPRHLYSRAAPRPVPSVSAEIELAQDATAENDSVFLATIVIRKGTQTQPVPCVVDRITKRVRLFAEGKWLAADEWLKQAPLPR